LRQFCERIIHGLDENGRLIEPLDTLLKDKSNKEEKELAKKALRIVQSFDPKGVGAKDAKECLVLQIPPHFSDKAKTELRTLIEDHLEDLSQNRIPYISKATGFSFEKIKDYRLEIMGMNPWPGTNFGKNKAHTVRPDVVVQKREDGTWDIQVANGRNRGLRISPYYLELARQKKLDADAKEYLRKNIASAKWLIEALGQRKSTLERVVDEIVTHQNDFLELGPEHIKPLKLKQIAEKLGVDVSTVSRAYRDKWMQTPQGLFPLKRFFSGALTQEKKADESDEGDEGNDTIAQAAVLQKIREIVDAEDKKTPLSDEEIVEILNKDGIEISRRTVAKYRGILGIPGSRGRRSWD
ncbi:MAG: RNA polymerase factor sigma-54, partial [Planctomycetia bacterium]|nr:RNA polymerase factor sigma-54 [Planctomycetia bacterium]